MQAKRAVTRRLPYRPPFDWESLIAFLGARAIPRVEAVVAGEYRRTIAIEGARGLVRVALAKRNELAISVSAELAASLPAIEARVRRMFDLDGDPDAVARHFASDPVVTPLIARWPGIRVPGIWDTFELSMRAVVGQQISVAGARTILGRIAAKYGTRVDDGEGPDLVFPAASRIERAEIVGMPASRAATIREVAKRFAKSDPDVSALEGIRGIGPWTMSYIRMRSGDRDAFPSGDLGLRKAAGGVDARELEKMSERWKPWRAYAAMLLWRSL